MLTTSDKKYISETIGSAIVKNNEVLIKEIMELFNVTNGRIDEVNERLSKKIDDVDGKLSKKIDEVNENLSERIDKVLDQLRTDDESINDHEERIEKLEDKVFATV